MCIHACVCSFYKWRGLRACSNAPPLVSLGAYALSSTSEVDVEEPDDRDGLLPSSASSAWSLAAHFVQCSGACPIVFRLSQLSAQTAILQFVHCQPHKAKLGSRSLRLCTRPFGLSEKTQMSFAPPVAVPPVAVAEVDATVSRCTSGGLEEASGLSEAFKKAAASPAVPSASAASISDAADRYVSTALLRSVPR